MARGGGCRDCALCTGNAFTGTGRNMARAGATIATLGIAKAVRRTCKICDHPMSEHIGQRAEAVGGVGAASAPAKKLPPANWYPEVASGRQRWWDGQAWGPYKDEWDARPPAVDPTEPAALDPIAPDHTERLIQLAELHRAGALTDDEFTAAKARLLGL